MAGRDVDVGCLLTCKTVSQITYTVLVESLNPAQSVYNKSHQCVLCTVCGIENFLGVQVPVICILKMFFLQKFIV